MFVLENKLRTYILVGRDFTAKCVVVAYPHEGPDAEKQTCQNTAASTITYAAYTPECTS